MRLRDIQRKRYKKKRIYESICYVSLGLFMYFAIGVFTNEITTKSDVENMPLPKADKIVVYEGNNSYSVVPIEKEDSIRVVYASTKLNVRSEPSKNSEKLGALNFNDNVELLEDYQGWGKIKYKGKAGYISLDYVTNQSAKYKDYDVPKDNSFKSYMGIDRITDTTSPQYSFLKNAYEGSYGLMLVEGRYVIAVGSYYSTKIGTLLDVYIKHSDGTTSVLPCVLGDLKDDKHTDAETHRQNPNGSVIEFVVNDNLSDTAKYHGDISKCSPMFEGEITKIRVYTKSYDFK